MVKTHHLSYPANDRSYFANIKKQVHQCSTQLRLPAGRISEIDIIIAELTSNLFKHSTGSGEILTCCNTNEKGNFIEIISMDGGPGFTNIEEVMADGYSTTGTMGAGLGSIKNLSDVFEIYTHRSWGTILRSRVYDNPAAHLPGKKIWCDALIVAKPGENCSGDGYSFYKTHNGFKVLHADGLGHGPEAKFAVDEAIKAFYDCTETSPSQTIMYLHERLLKTRGMVANVIFYNEEKQKWNIAGVGNISTRWAGNSGERTYTASNGIIGHTLPSKINELELSLEDYLQFVSCSDGIKSRWNLEKCKAAHRHSLLIQAATVYKEFSRRTDDVSVVVCKIT